MGSRKRDIEREILEGIRELKRGDRGRVTTVQGELKAAKPLSSASRMTGGQVLDEAMCNDGGAKYFEVVIVARSPRTDIWLAHEGHLVQKSDGVLETSILPGDYTVEFGLGSPTYPLHVTRDVRWTEEEITAGPPCSRPIPCVPPPDSDP